jgi:hypothetical protein
VLLVVGTMLLGTAESLAQDSTTGAIRGRVVDIDTGEALAGTTIIATSPVMQGQQTRMSDGDGRFEFATLTPGTYLLTFYYGTAQVQRSGVRVPLGKVTTVNQKVNTLSGEVITIKGKGTAVDVTTTTQITSITTEQLRNLPVPGRSFESALGQAAGSQGDAGGVAFSGSTSLENQYVIDGVNTTSLGFGTAGTGLINEFIDEIQVITGGYQSEFGRSTGGIVNVVTKQGTNKLRGSAFATMIPYQVRRTPVRDFSTSIDSTSDLDYSLDFGFDLGGPIIKDKLWYYVGFAPQLSQTDITRMVQRRTDCRSVLPNGELSLCNPEMYFDGEPDEDPLTGDLIYELVDSQSWKTNSQAYQWVAKVNYAPKPEHQGQISTVAVPRTGQGIFGVTGASEAIRADYGGLTTDVSAKWTSKFNDNKTTVELVGGWHRSKYDQDALDDSVLDTPTTRVYLSNLSRFSAAGKEDVAVQQGCNDSNNMQVDPYPLIENCPVFEYWLDSPGFTIDNEEERKAGSLKVTQRADKFGDHIVKAGVDIEDNVITDYQHLTGGRYFQMIPDPGYNQVRVYRYIKSSPDGANNCGYDEGEFGGMTQRTCDFLDKNEVIGRTLNWSAFLQDSWQPKPNITINAGVRYEEQRLRYAEHLQGTIDPFSEQRLGKNALTLKDMWAPRLGAVYDWTKEGRGKAYASFGRFFESIPMALNTFSFAGSSLYGQFFHFDQCVEGNTQSPDSSGVAPSPYNCPTSIDETNAPTEGDLYRGGTTAVAPGTKAQYMDEAILGAEYEIAEDLRIGLAYKNRRLGRILEDLSSDGGDSYFIGNPGHFTQAEENALIKKIEALDEGDPERGRLQANLEQFRGLRDFETPRREYNALEFTLTKRVSKDFYVQGSYTYSRTEGNYPGLLNSDTGAALPNFGTQFDLPELLANRDGRLPQDRPHYLKLDAYYVFDLEKAGQVTVGGRFRALSGSPVDVLGSNERYGFGQSYLLKRGAQGRVGYTTGTDLHVAYARRLGNNELSAFFDIFNAFNQEQTARVDEIYTFDNVNPVVGGRAEDLVYAKQLSQAGGETGLPATRNPGFGKPTARFSPLFMRIGMRLSF